MARQARIVVQGYPHHMVHRGNLRAQVFFSDDDRRFTLEMRLQCATRFGAEIWAYCLILGAGYNGYDITVPEPDSFKDCVDCEEGPDFVDSIGITWP